MSLPRPPTRTGLDIYYRLTDQKLQIIKGSGLIQYNT